MKAFMALYQNPTSVRGLSDPNKHLRMETWISLMILCCKEHHMSSKGMAHFLSFTLLTLSLHCFYPELLPQLLHQHPNCQ
jgi:hypothetical protein